MHVRKGPQPSARALGLALAALCGPAAPPALAQGAVAKAEAPRRSERVRTFDVRHLKAELKLDTKANALQGTVTQTIAPLFAGMAALDLDCARELSVRSVTIGPRAKPAACAFVRREDTLAVTLDRPYTPDEAFDLTVEYACVGPQEGIYFIKPDAGAEPGTPVCVWTQGEPEETRHWIPCYDHPNDRFTSEMIVTVETPLFALSNGVLLDTRDNPDGTTTYHWKMETPHVSYLLSLAASEFRVVHDRAGDLPVDYYVLKNHDEATARRALGKTPRMVGFFADKTGQRYPFAKYAQAVVPEFTAGGMENITATTLHDYVLADAPSYLELESDGLVAHELAHQWFGDLLTCRDWPHLWLNEGFASYFDPLFKEFDQGEDAFRFAMAGEFRSYASGDRNQRRPLVGRRYSDPMELFDAVTYNKGACVLHALRGVLGDEAWWKGIRQYVAANAGRLVETDDLRKAMEAASGKDLAWFFGQWVDRGGHPELKAKWRFESDDKTVRLRVDQVQKVDEKTPLFRLPTTVALVEAKGTRSVAILIDGASQEFVIPCDARPKTVRIDPQGWLPKELTWDKPLEEWVEQVASSPDALGRLEAARELAAREDEPQARAALLAAVEREPFPLARAEMVGLVAGLEEKGRPALLAAAADKNARVRVAALRSLVGGPLDAPAEALFRAALARPDEAYGARRAALRGLVGGKAKDADDLLASALKNPAGNGSLAAEALGLKVERDGPRGRDAAVLYSKPGQPLYLRRKALEALGRLAGPDDPELTKALFDLAGDPNRGLRKAVWARLGEGPVAGALPVLEAQLARETGKGKATLAAVVEKLKAARSAPKADHAEEAATLEKKAADLELQARELRNRAEALKLKDAREALARPPG